MLLQKLKDVLKEIESFKQTGRTTKLFEEVLENDEKVSVICFPTYKNAVCAFHSLRYFIYNNRDKYFLISLQQAFLRCDVKCYKKEPTEKIIYINGFTKGDKDRHCKVYIDHSYLEYDLQKLINKYEEK